MAHYPLPTTHSYTHTLIHSYTHKLIHSYTHTLTHSYTHTLIHSYTHTLIHSYTIQLPTIALTPPRILVPFTTSHGSAHALVSFRRVNAPPIQPLSPIHLHQGYYNIYKSTRRRKSIPRQRWRMLVCRDKNDSRKRSKTE